MAELALANQYAKALLEVAQAAGGTAAAEAALDELTRFTEVFLSSRDLRTILLSPVVEHPQKVRVIERLCESIGASRPVRNFLNVVTKKRRLALLGHIRDRYQALLDEAENIVRAEVRTALPATEAQRQALESKLAEVTGGQVRCGYLIDDSLVGGLMVRIGSSVFDGSVRGHLEALRRRLVSGS
ncbi:MAG: ATP synthase F1 subunit delta [Bryobacteraceae bacterium]|nr:ATP synthase F1 subunit delta [Bryobacteraceae bacterium]